MPDGMLDDLHRDYAGLLLEAMNAGGNEAVDETIGVIAHVLLSRDTSSSFMRSSQIDNCLTVLSQAANTTVDNVRRQAQLASAWRASATPVVNRMRDEGNPALTTYITLLQQAASYASRIQPVDLQSINAATLISATQGFSRPKDSRGSEASQGSSNYSPPAVSPPVIPLSTPQGGAVSRSSTSTTTPLAEQEETLEELYAELDALVGLARVKEEVKKQAALLKIMRLRDEQSLTEPDITRHMIFTGNPGSGKTTIARLVSRIYRAIKVLDKGQLVEVDKSGLVAGYLGQSEEKTRKVIDEAIGGVLFIDEAYTLNSDEYGEAVVGILVKSAEDDRDKLVIILAGYTGPMEDFLGINPGLQSRFRTVIDFPDYSEDELVTIFQRMIEKSDYTCEDDALTELRALIRAQVHDESFGNARFVRNCFEDAILRHALRISTVENPTKEQLMLLSAEDVRGAGLTLPPVEQVEESEIVEGPAEP